MTLLLMAAGSGSRYGKLKQFDALGPKEEFLMEFSIYDAIQKGCKHVVVITRAERQDFLNNYLTGRLPAEIQLDVVVQDINDLPSGVTVTTQRTKPWGTAHAVWSARNVVNDDFLVINADDYYGSRAFEAAADFVRDYKDPASFAMVGYELKDTLSEHGSVSRGVCKTEDGNLLGIKEYTKIEKTGDSITDHDSGKQLNENTLVSMNCWVCTPKIFDYIEQDFRSFLKDEEQLEKGELYLPFVIAQMLEENEIRVSVLDAKSSWFGVTYYPDKEEAVNELDRLTESGAYPSPLWSDC